MIFICHTPKPETLALIERIENGEEELIGPFSSKEELWRSLEISSSENTEEEFHSFASLEEAKEWLEETYPDILEK